MTKRLDEFAKLVCPPRPADPAITAWKINFTDRVMECAKDNPTSFLAMLCANARHFPESIPLFANAIEDMATAYSDEAGELNAYVTARREQAAEARS